MGDPELPREIPPSAATASDVITGPTSDVRSGKLSVGKHANVKNAYFNFFKSVISVKETG